MFTIDSWFKSKANRYYYIFFRQLIQIQSQQLLLHFNCFFTRNIDYLNLILSNALWKWKNVEKTRSISKIKKSYPFLDNYPLIICDLIHIKIATVIFYIQLIGNWLRDFRKYGKWHHKTNLILLWFSFPITRYILRTQRFFRKMATDRYEYFWWLTGTP